MRLPSNFGKGLKRRFRELRFYRREKHEADSEGGANALRNARPKRSPLIPQPSAVGVFDQVAEDRLKTGFLRVKRELASRRRKIRALTAAETHARAHPRRVKFGGVRAPREPRSPS